VTFEAVKERARRRVWMGYPMVVRVRAATTTDDEDEVTIADYN
jgi:hypothetical protein